MEENLFNLLSKAVAAYLEGLNWSYVITVMAVSYFTIKNSVVKNLKPEWLKRFMLSVPLAWRVVIVGSVIAIIYMLLETDTITKIYLLRLIRSLISAMVLYALFIRKLVQAIEDRVDSYLKRKKSKEDDEG